MDNGREILPVVDSTGKMIGSAPRSVCHDGVSRLLHPVVHLHVFDTSGRLLLQKRSMRKLIQPGRWDTAVGGHVDCGENISQALRREALEEIGLRSIDGAQLIANYLFESDVERELIYCFKIVVDADESLRIFEPDDIDELRFWTLDEIIKSLGQGRFTPNFEQEFSTIIMPR